MPSQHKYAPGLATEPPWRMRAAVPMAHASAKPTSQRKLRLATVLGGSGARLRVQRARIAAAATRRHKVFEFEGLGAGVQDEIRRDDEVFGGSVYDFGYGGGVLLDASAHESSSCA